MNFLKSFKNQIVIKELDELALNDQIINLRKRMESLRHNADTMFKQGVDELKTS